MQAQNITFIDNLAVEHKYIPLSIDKDMASFVMLGTSPLHNRYLTISVANPKGAPTNDSIIRRRKARLVLKRPLLQTIDGIGVKSSEDIMDVTFTLPEVLTTATVTTRIENLISVLNDVLIKDVITTGLPVY